MKRIPYRYLLLGAVVVFIASFAFIYEAFLKKGVIPVNGKSILYIPTGSTYENVKDSLNAHFKISNPGLMEMVVKRKGYRKLIKPGRYILQSNLSYPQLINILRSGRQTPINLTFTNIRTIYNLAGKVGGQIEADSVQIINFLTDKENYKNDGFTRENVISVFIPNTYQLFWNTSPAGFYSRMLKEYKKFWNKERLQKAKEKSLTQAEVSILASIIDEEATRSDEKPRIAGVYLNRLKRGIPLQADPTIIFALNDYTITRVLYKHLLVDSPYNTYKHTGFPPGPIGCPTIEGLDAVLNAEKHDYLFFAAKADFSGYHNFSRTLAEHNRYAALYQKELNKRKIFR